MSLTQNEHGQFLINLAEEFNRLVEMGAGNRKEDERELQEVIARLALAVVNLTCPKDWAILCAELLESETVRRSKVSARFPELGFYNTIGPLDDDIGAGVPSVGDAIDDILDIWADLDRSRLIAQRKGIRSGVKYMVGSYYAHWGRHLHDLNLFLHERRVAL